MNYVKDVYGKQPTDLPDEKKAELYLDYVNDFLTVGKFSEFYNFKETDAKIIIDEGRKIHGGIGYVQV